ncbi:MAG: type II secretion system F family protein [Armatimonadetes bacterium]|nr:type II secretion system F family protein [Armatimonadota bacterium]
MRFAYHCTDSEGLPRKGLIESSSESAAQEELRGRGWTIESVRSLARRASGPVPVPPAAAASGAATTRRLADDAPPGAGTRSRGLDSRSLSLLTLHLATMASAGIPFERSLEALSRGTSPAVAEVCKDVRQRLLRGYPLSRSMAASSGVFSPVFINLIRIGEETGSIPRVLHSLAEDLRRAEDRRSRLFASLIYPIFVVLVSALMVAFIFYYMLPRFLSILPDLGGEVPWLTRAVSAVADPDLLLLGMGLLAGGALWWVTASRTPAGRLSIQRILYGIPGPGKYLLEALIARLARSLGLMLSSGIPVAAALPLLVSPTSGYYVLDEAIREIRTEFAGDGDLIGAFERSRLMPRLLVQMLAAGDATGELNVFLERYADFSEERIDLAVENCLRLLEPLTIAILGVVTGVVVLAVFLPVYQLVLAQ